MIGGNAIAVVPIAVASTTVIVTIGGCVLAVDSFVPGAVIVDAFFGCQAIGSFVPGAEAHDDCK